MEHVEKLPTNRLASYVQNIVFERGTTDVSADDVGKILCSTAIYREALAQLLAQPQVAQRSQEWFEMRKSRLTASDLAQAMNKGKFGTRQQLLFKKACPELAPPFPTNNPALQWGVMFEPMASRCYAQRHNDIAIHEFGLIPHPSLECFGASPDGITDLGVMLEFKCPLRRKIDGHIPEQYEIQMQGQMAVCGLHECDYVECDMQKLNTREDYLQLVPEKQTTDHGIILDRGQDCEDDRYMYSPEYVTPREALAWLDKQRCSPQWGNSWVVLWKLRKINIMRVTFDKDQWDTYVPHIKQFWKDVEDTRANAVTNGQGSPSKPNVVKRKKVAFEFIEDEDEVGST